MAEIRSPRRQPGTVADKREIGEPILHDASYVTAFLERQNKIILVEIGDETVTDQNIFAPAQIYENA